MNRLSECIEDAEAVIAAKVIDRLLTPAVPLTLNLIYTAILDCTRGYSHSVARVVCGEWAYLSLVHLLQSVGYNPNESAAYKIWGAPVQFDDLLSYNEIIVLSPMHVERFRVTCP